MSGVRLTENGVAGKQAKATERPTDWVGREDGFWRRGAHQKNFEDGQAILTRQPCFDVTQSGWTGMDWTGCASGRARVPNVNKVRLVREYLSLSLSLSSSNVYLDLSTVTNYIDRLQR